ncbi:hypothetical protein ACFLYA_02480 [Candidatus Dependentiae bacterium]
MKKTLLLLLFALSYSANTLTMFVMGTCFNRLKKELSEIAQGLDRRQYKVKSEKRSDLTEKDILLTRIELYNEVQTIFLRLDFKTLTFIDIEIISSNKIWYRHRGEGGLNYILIDDNVIKAYADYPDYNYKNLLNKIKNKLMSIAKTTPEYKRIRIQRAEPKKERFRFMKEHEEPFYMTRERVSPKPPRPIKRTDTRKTREKILKKTRRRPAPKQPKKPEHRTITVYEKMKYEKPPVARYKKPEPKPKKKSKFEELRQRWERGIK